MHTVIDAVTPQADYSELAIHKAAVRLLPLLALGYGVAYMDRVNIGFASLRMNADLHFSATVYGFGGGLFFLSYGLLEVPSNLLLVRFGARRWLARIMITWGLLAMAMMFVRTPMQFYATRLLLGAAEAGFFPGAVFYVSQWFPSEYRGRAISRFYVAYTVSSIFMGALAGVLLSFQGYLGLAGWQWLFLIEGMPAIVLGGVFLLFLPDSPDEAPWLSTQERSALLARMAGDSHFGRRHPVSDSLRALQDSRVFLLGVATFCVRGGSYALSLYGPTVISGLTGWSPATIGYTTAGAYALAAVAMLGNATHSDHSRERFFHTALPYVIVAAGSVVLGISDTSPIAFSGYVLSVVAAAAGEGAVWLIPSDAFVGPLKEVGVAAIGSIGMMGAFVGPYVFGVVRDATGDYSTGLVLVALLYLTAAGSVLYFRYAHPPRGVVSAQQALV